MSIVGPPEARPVDGLAIDFVVESDRVQLNEIVQRVRDGRLRTDIGKVSIVGAGMRSHPGVAAKVFKTLAEQTINIEMISTSPIKISCIIRSERVPEAVQALHSAFALGEGAVHAAPFGQEPR